MQELLNRAAHQIELLLAPAALVQLIALGLALLGAQAIGRRVRASDPTRTISDVPGFQNRIAEALFIVSPHIGGLVLTSAIGGLFHLWKQAAGILDLATTLIGLLLLIRLGVYIFRVSVGDRAPIKGWGNTISLVIWSILALHTLGWFEPVVEALDSIGIKAGASKVTLWSVLKVIFTVTLFVVIATWLARWAERRLMAIQTIAISMRLGLAKSVQAILIGLSILLGLNAAGLDLTTFNVIAGAIGIGLGFGLQAIASNFVSGFVLLMDRSIKPGDVISFTGTTGTTTEGFGWVQELRGRYIVVRDRDGVETLVPNQHLITNPVINWSYTDPRVRIKLPVRISYDDDPEVAMALLLKAAEDHTRILRDPAPVARLMAFGDSGLELELRFWISDPQEGVNNVRSDVNRIIWRLFKEQRIKIPVTQQEVAVRKSSDA
jgi:small-conductance mechanosensitive channel